MSLPEQTSLDFTIKCVLPPGIHVVYMRKIIESLFPTLVITFLLTFIFCSLFRQISFTKYTLNIPIGKKKVGVKKSRQKIWSVKKLVI